MQAIAFEEQQRVTAYQPTPAEQQAFAVMQARLVSLLLRFDEPRFRSYFSSQSDQHSQQLEEALQPYRDLAAMMLLRDELFDDILPRIVRRLSFEAPRQTMIEEPPTRGRIDWERTLDQSWASLPGEPALELYTRQRRRDFATPENILTVAVVLEYRATVQHMLWNDQLVARMDMLQHPLQDILEQCDRELAFPQFATLRSSAEQILEQGAIEELIERVQERAIPGGNSSYADLISWRERLYGLPLLGRDPAQQTTLALGADPERDNYLYQLWIFYELAAVLREGGQLLADGLTLQPMRLRFRWQECSYELFHDQVVSLPAASWQAISAAEHHVPGVRPDFYIQRCEPPMQRVTADEHLIWREPGMIWDAKYYREQSSANAPAMPIKRMLADLTLLGERYGVLLFAFVAGMQPGDPYILTPQPGADQTLVPDQTIRIQPLCPRMPEADPLLRETLMTLLDELHTQLATPRIPRCSGIFLDQLNVEPQLPLRDRWQQPIENSSRDLLICPKPHIGAWRIDLVNRQQHCCTDARLCHIIGQEGIQKPLRPPRTIDDLLSELDQLLRDGGQALLDEQGQAAAAIAERIERLTRSFADLSKVDLEIYYRRLRDLGMAQTLELLGPVERESLALSEFLKDQLDRIHANDFSAPAIHISSVMEVEIKRRVFQCPTLVGDLSNPKRHTLGALPFLQRNADTEVNWQHILDYVHPRWHAQPDPDDPDRSISFEQLVKKAINPIAQYRNNAAHTEPLSRDDYTKLQQIIFQGGKLGYSALNALLLCWKA